MRPNLPQRSSSNESNPVQREARIHSIYDKYLYDPKDLNSSDPRIRQLARQASLAHQHQQHQHSNSNSLSKQPLSIIHDEEEVQSNRSQGTMSTASSSAPLVKRAAFSEGTKTNDAPASGGGHKRDESAGGVWAGFITGGVASDDSDSDDDDEGVSRRRQPATPSAAAAPPSPATPSRASWTSRAAAVGSRPPDSASQNPLSLKLLGLKSLKDGGAPIGGSRSPNASSSAGERSFDIVQYAPKSPSRFDIERSQDEAARRMQQQQDDMDEEIRRSRVQSQSDYGDTAEEIDRHGSTINFGAGAGGISALDEYMNDRARDSRAGVQLEDAPASPRIASPPNAPISVTRAPVEPQRSPEVPEQRGGLTTHAANVGGAGRPVSPRTALTRQLGLATPSPLPDGAARNGERSDYFGGGDTSIASSSPTRPQAAGTPPFQYASSNGHSPAPSSQPPNGASPSPRNLAAQPLPPSSLRGPPPPPHDADPFGGGPPVPLQRGPPPGANGIMPAQRGSPSPPQGAQNRGPPPPPASMRAGGPQPPPLAMQRGAPPPQQQQQQQQQQRGMLPGFSNVQQPRSPGPNGAPLQSPRGPPPPPHGPNGFRGPPPPGAQQQQQGGLHPNGPPSGGPFPRGGPPPPGPGFSDSRRPQQGGAPGQRRSNVFRRSMAFMTGGGNGQQQQQGGPQGGGPGAQRGAGPNGQGNAQRRSMFRRSMAFFTGRNAAPPTAAPAMDEDDDANAPQPRVRGFVDDEKPVQRKSQYLGAGGMGDEWDVSGAGSKFWRRFSQAQRAAQKPDPVSQRWRDKALSGRKRVNCLAALGLLCIVGAIVGIIVWRESKNKASDTPGSINRADFGGTNAGGTIVAQPTTAPVGAAVGEVTDDGGAVATSTPKARGTRTRTRRRSTRTLDERAYVAPATLTPRSPTPAEVVEAIQDSILAQRAGPHPLPRKRSVRRLDWQSEQTLHRRAHHVAVRNEKEDE